MFLLVADSHLTDNGSLYWQKHWWHAGCNILRKSVDTSSMMFNFVSLVPSVAIGCCHPFIRYWRSLLAKTTAICTQPHPEYQHQWSFKSFSCCIFGNWGTARIFTLILELLNDLIGKMTIYQRRNSDSKLINIASCNTCKILFLGFANVLFILYYSQTPNTDAIY
jgi:hypothetical protein